MHIPLILAGPGIPRGVRSSTVVSNRHLAPTLARLGGGDMPRMEGDDFDFLLGGEFSDRAFFQTVKGIWQHRARQPLHGL